MSWNIVPTDNLSYELINGSSTVVELSRRVRPNLGALLVKFEDAGIPISYTTGLKLIKLTILKQGVGFYRNGEIFLSCSSSEELHLPEVFIHEIGHHVDHLEAISDDPQIVVEKRKRARFMSDKYARKNVNEYVAEGFTTYYFGTGDEISKMKEMNTKLYNRIKQAHNKYTKINRN